MQPSDDTSDVSLKAGKMYLNRFCVDEDAAFESNGVYYLEKQPIFNPYKDVKDKVASRAKGQEILFYRIEILSNLLSMIIP